MNPDNNALARTWFIGGPPRIGKSLFAKKLASELSAYAVVSTECIRNAAKKACSEKDSDLFIINKLNDLSDKSWVDLYKNSPEQVVDLQNRESKALWSSLVSFCNGFVEDDMIHVVEGVHVLPELVAGMHRRPNNVVFLGNTRADHGNAILSYASRNPQQDWMTAMGYSEEKMRAMGQYVLSMSLFFKSEATKYGFSYFEIDDDAFGQSLDVIAKSVQESARV